MSTQLIKLQSSLFHAPGSFSPSGLGLLKKCPIWGLWGFGKVSGKILGVARRSWHNSCVVYCIIYQYNNTVRMVLMFLKPIGAFLGFSPSGGFSVTIWALVGGVGHTHELIHPIHNVSLGNWGGFGEYGKHQIRYKQQETQKPFFALSWKISVTWVALVGGIADPPHQNHIV